MRGRSGAFQALNSMDEESGRKHKKEKKQKKFKKKRQEVEEDPVDSERGPDPPQQQAKDRYAQSAPKTLNEKQAVNWENINYPPVLRLFHYDYYELKNPVEFQLCQWEQWIFIFQSAILLFNLIVQVILTAAGAPDAYVYIIVSFFLLILYTVVGIFVHVWVYRALALESGVHYLVWLVAHFVWLVAQLVLALAHGHNVEGFTNITRARDLGGALGSFWIATTVIESVAWLGCVGWGLALAGKAIQHFNSGAFKGEVKGPKLFSRKQMIKSVLGF